MHDKQTVELKTTTTKNSLGAHSFNLELTPFNNGGKNIFDSVSPTTIPVKKKSAVEGYWNM